MVTGQYFSVKCLWAVIIRDSVPVWQDLGLTALFLKSTVVVNSIPS